MGAPKKKWSEEEEAALNAGIERYGAGKWSAILNDPDYQTVLSARTNVDLKDKWRNIKVMRNGVGHRQRGFGVPKLKSQNKNQAATSGAIVTKPAKLQNKDSVPSTSGLALVMKPPEDLNNDMQIDPQSSDMEIVQVEKHGTTALVNVKYEVDVEQQPKMLGEAVEVVKHGSTAKAATVKHEIDYFVNMTAEEAAIAAEEAVAEAEAAIERAERAVREAEAAEQEAEAARMFAQGKIDASRRHVLSALSRGVSCSTEICNNQKH